MESPTPTHDFAELVDLAADRLGGAVVYANDEFFASKDNLLKPERPVFLEGKYTDRGKWMDGWETRRRRIPGHDFCLVRLGLPGIIRGVDVDTTHFRGNYPEACSIDACVVTGHPEPESLLRPDTPWVEILPRTLLQGNAPNLIPLDAPESRFTHLRLNIYPDGGVARLRVFGEVLPEPRLLRGGEIDLVAVENGGHVIACNDMFFGTRHNLILPGRSTHMGDGWETRRSRRPGPDWAILRLGAQGTVSRIEVETTHFKGNAPESCAIDVCDLGERPSADLLRADFPFTELLPRTRLLPHTRHEFTEADLRRTGPITHARLRIYPDGGVARLRLYGSVTPAGRLAHGLSWLNRLGAAEAEAQLLTCCGSRTWARLLTAERPFADLEALLARGRVLWWSLSHDDWREAFAAHPRIGEDRAAARWSREEQAGASAATTEVRAALAEANGAYHDRFGYIYIVCATGKSAEAMLEQARHRLTHSPETEIRVAAEEQQKITDLRLEKLVLR